HLGSSYTCERRLGREHGLTPVFTDYFRVDYGVGKAECRSRSDVQKQIQTEEAQVVEHVGTQASTFGHKCTVDCLVCGRCNRYPKLSAGLRRLDSLRYIYPQMTQIAQIGKSDDLYKSIRLP